ncbi:hypothetical protein [Nitratifractor sp.]|uniref:hypothetical protein n=1 Tax=Nitratifractor sp. TaxID=2268144 RepID=UPI0025DCB58A|nr:hypothetical protein [Nitratifractor sp.]
MLEKFFYLEGAYLILGGIILLITLYVTTRPFMSSAAPRKGLTIVAIVLALFIGLHFWVTTSRIASVKAAFYAGKPVLCESRMLRKMAQSIEIRKDTAARWRIEGDNFVSPEYTRPFHLARCIVK